MLRPRIIPCLLVHRGGLVKTINFKDGKYVGDPINAVRIFNEKEVDEIVVLDIDATSEGREPNYELIRKLSAECRMPLCYGGGITALDQAERIISMGVEKVALSAAAINDPSIIARLAEVIGRQSVVAVIDVLKSGMFRKYEAVTHNGSKRTGVNPISLAKQFEQLGAGEIIVNSVDQDGTMNGFDIKLVQSVREAINIPMTALGGAGSLEDLGTLLEECGHIGVAAGSLFGFKGKYRAVLINYPNRQQKDSVFRAAKALAV